MKGFLEEIPKEILKGIPEGSSRGIHEEGTDFVYQLLSLLTPRYSNFSKFKWCLRIKTKN